MRGRATRAIVRIEQMAVIRRPGSGVAERCFPGARATQATFWRACCYDRGYHAFALVRIFWIPLRSAGAELVGGASASKQLSVMITVVRLHRTTRTGDGREPYGPVGRPTQGTLWCALI